MVDSASYPTDGESRPPRRQRHDQKSSRTAPHDERYRDERHRDRYQNQEERGPRRAREDVGRSQSKDQEAEERGQGRHHREGRDGYREHNSGHSRSHQDHYKDREDYRSERSPRQHHGRDDYHKERKPYEERDRQQERYVRSPQHRGYHADSKIPENYSPSERSFPPNGANMHEMEYYEEPAGGILDCHKCRYLCTGRACCQLVEVLLNMLILICCSVSYNSTGGFTGISNLGGIYYYQFGGAYSGFSGADGEKAQKLDVDFYNLKLPTVTASMAFGGALMAFCCLLVLLGVLRVPWRWPIWLLVECVLDVAIALGYIPALYFYFQLLQEAYGSQVCKDREALYTSKGYNGFSCALHGADIAAALFACMAIIAFVMSALLAIKGFRSVRKRKEKQVNMLEF